MTTERAQDERDEKLHSLRVPLPKPYRYAATMIVNDVWYKCVHFNEEESWIDNAKAVALTEATLEKLCKGFEQLAEQYKKIAEDADRQRREIQQFVYTLRDPTSASPPQ